MSPTHPNREVSDCPATHAPLFAFVRPRSQTVGFIGETGFNWLPRAVSGGSANVLQYRLTLNARVEARRARSLHIVRRNPGKEAQRPHARFCGEQRRESTSRSPSPDARSHSSDRSAPGSGCQAVSWPTCGTHRPTRHSTRTWRGSAASSRTRGPRSGWPSCSTPLS
jgi:hypothetical protein